MFCLYASCFGLLFQERVRIALKMIFNAFASLSVGPVYCSWDSKVV